MRNKFGAIKAKSQFSKHTFDSKAERDYLDLVLQPQVTAGLISGLVEQPKVQLTQYHSYKPDFAFMEAGRMVYVDVKGVETDRFRINCNLWREFGPGVLRITKRQTGRTPFKVIKEIHPGSGAHNGF